MSALTILSLIQAIMKLAPEVVSIIEGIVGHGNSIAPEELSEILAKATELSKAAVVVSPIDTASEAPDAVVESTSDTQHVA